MKTLSSFTQHQQQQQQQHRVLRAAHPATPSTAGLVRISTRAVRMQRRDVVLAGGGLLAAALLPLLAPAADAAATDLKTNAGSSSSSAAGPSGISIAPINQAAKAAIEARDEAADFKCKGGMFDCDADRSEFAHKQYQDWLAAGGVPKRIREGNPAGPKSY